MSRLPSTGAVGAGVGITPQRRDALACGLLGEMRLPRALDLVGNTTNGSHDSANDGNATDGTGQNSKKRWHFNLPRTRSVTRLPATPWRK